MTIRRAAFLLLIVCAPACQVEPGNGRLGGWDFAVDKKPELWGKYQPSGLYVLKRDVFLIDSERTNGPTLVPGIGWDVPPGTLRGPTTTAEYLADPKKWRWVEGVVTADTRLRVQALRGKGNLRDSELTVHYVRARLMDGLFQGRVVDLQPLSLYAAEPDSRRVTLTGPNEDFLEPAP